MSGRFCSIDRLRYTYCYEMKSPRDSDQLGAWPTAEKVPWRD